MQASAAQRTAGCVDERRECSVQRAHVLRPIARRRRQRAVRAAHGAHLRARGSGASARLGWRKAREFAARSDAATAAALPRPLLARRRARAVVTAALARSIRHCG